MLVRLLSLCAVLASLAGMVAARPCCHDEKDPVKVTLIVILASEDGATIDPRLKAIAEEVRKLNPSLKSFKLKSMECKSFKPGEKVLFPSVDEQKVEMIIKHGADKNNRVSLAVIAPTMAEIEYQSVCGKFLPIVTRYQTKTRERLILAIRVQPCRGE